MSKSTTKKGFDFARNSIYTFDPLEVCLDGGLTFIVDKAERGPLDTKATNDLQVDDRLRLEKPLEDTFRDGIFANGVQVPILIAKLNDIAVVIDGKQRVRAARWANAQRIKQGMPPMKLSGVIQRDVTKLGMLSAMVRLNNARRDDTLDDKIRKLRDILSLTGDNYQYASKEFNLGEQRLKELIAFDDHATKELREAVANSKLSSFSTALELAKIRDPDRQRETLSKMLMSADGKKPSTRDARAARQGSDDAAPSARTRVAQKALLSYIIEPPKGKPLLKENDSDSYWAGVAAALRLVTGVGEADPRLADALKHAVGQASDSE